MRLNYLHTKKAKITKNVCANLTILVTLINETNHHFGYLFFKDAAQRVLLPSAHGLQS